MAAIRVLVVDDYEPWRRFVSTTFRKQQELQMVGHVSDGLEAIQQAENLQPDLILLDIGLPTLNGIEAARRIREVSPSSKILFVSQNRSSDVVEAALSTGAGGFVVKAEAGKELLPAIKALLEEKRFVSPSLRGQPGDHAAAVHCHEVAFYPNDASVVDGYARFIESALKMGNAIIVVVTEPHRASLLPRLGADGVDVPAAIEQGNYIPLDAADAISTLTVKDMPDPVRCAKVIGDLVTGAAKGVKREHGRVAACGEIAPTMLSNGNVEGAITLEHLWDEITRGYGVHTLCGYVWSASLSKGGRPIFERICAEHSGVHTN